MRKTRKSGRSRKKPELDEIISFATYADDLCLYSVVFRDFEALVETSLKEFLGKEEIPRHRIVIVKRDDKVLYVKHGCCPRCGNKLESEDKEKRCTVCDYIIHAT